jgi:hypothetical protein
MSIIEIMGYVYLLLSISPDNVETHKIGITTREPSIRVKELQTGNSNEIRCLRKYKTKNYLKVEQWLHRKYSNQTTEAMNEWRMLTNEQVFSFIDDCKEADDIISFLIENNSLY